jgi:hypothetical protein
MKRCQALRGLSREHHEALVLARHASATAADPGGEGARQQRDHLLLRWDAQFELHFALEEQVLLPALVAAGHTGLASEALAQHAELRCLGKSLESGEPLALAAWGDAMATHVRFEERTLFPLAEIALDFSALPDLIPLFAAH